MTAGHDGGREKQAVEKKAKVEQQRARRDDDARREVVQVDLRYRGASRSAGGAAVDALQQTGVGSSEMSGFVVISRNQALSLCTSMEAFPTFRLSPPQQTAALSSAKRSATAAAQYWLAHTDANWEVATLVIRPFEPHTLQSTIWTSSHNGQHSRHVIALPDPTRACPLLILVVTAVYTAGRSSWPLTGRSTATSGAAKLSTSALSLRPTQTSASPGNRE